MWRRLVEVQQKTSVVALDAKAVTAGGAIDQKTHNPTALLYPLKPTAKDEVPQPYCHTMKSMKSFIQYTPMLIYAHVGASVPEKGKILQLQPVFGVVIGWGHGVTPRGSTRGCTETVHASLLHTLSTFHRPMHDV